VEAFEALEIDVLGAGAEHVAPGLGHEHVAAEVLAKAEDMVPERRHGVRRAIVAPRSVMSRTSGSA
jgi:hypothetical protein